MPQATARIPAEGMDRTRFRGPRKALCAHEVDMQHQRGPQGHRQAFNNARLTLLNSQNMANFHASSTKLLLCEFSIYFPGDGKLLHHHHA